MNKILLSAPHMSDEGYEQKYIKEAFDTNWIACVGNNVDMFEEEIAEVVHANKTVAVYSGTAAIHMALKAVGINAGDIVFCQSLTFSASTNPIIYENGIPVFIDSEEASWNMSPTALRKGLQKYKEIDKLPKAVIVVHLYGNVANILEIKEICEEYNVALIEDSAESLGTTINGKYSGTFGEFGIFSFNGNKIITCSGGGMVICNGENALNNAEKIKFWSTQAREPERYYQHTEIGYNYRMSNIVAGIGRGQLKVLNQRIERKRYIYHYYKNELSHIKDITFIPIDSYNSVSNCWLTVIQVAPKSKIRPLDILLSLEKNNIETRPVWKPMHLQPVFEKYDYIDNDHVSQTLFDNGLCLPSGTSMTDNDLSRICKIIKELWK